jgi:23S rRNA pseudouridine1911/1915/1917 synthase
LQANPRLAVSILYEDTAVVVVDKPPGMPGHALRAEETETVANFLLAWDPRLSGIGDHPLEPGMVHRLDTDTSGVVLVARTAAAYRALRAQFSLHQVGKEYRALVHGDVRRPGSVRAPIAHHRDRRKMRVCAPGEHAVDARPAETHYRPLECFGRHTLLEVHIRTGVMHQIRVHLASIGHPIVGDRLYGRPPGSGEPPRHLLHAAGIDFIHPETGAPMHISSPLPADFSACVEAVRRKGNSRV